MPYSVMLFALPTKENLQLYLCLIMLSQHTKTLSMDGIATLNQATICFLF